MRHQRLFLYCHKFAMRLVMTWCSSLTAGCGEDIIKARAAGANFVMDGRSFLYGLGAAGEKGIHRITDILARGRYHHGLIGETDLAAGIHNLAV